MPSDRGTGGTGAQKNRVPHPNNGGCMTLSWLGCVGGEVQPDVGFGCGGWWQAEKLMHGHNSCMIQMPKRAWPSSLSFFISVPTLVPPSHSSSPTFLPRPCLISFGISPPQDNVRALTHSRNPSAPILVLVVVRGVGILIVDCAVCGPSRTKMVADTISEGILHTVIVCGILAWR